MSHVFDMQLFKKSDFADGLQTVPPVKYQGCCMLFDRNQPILLER